MIFCSVGWYFSVNVLGLPGAKKEDYFLTAEFPYNFFFKRSFNHICGLNS